MAKRVGYRCSNPNCRLPTAGPQDDPAKAVNVGEAAHIIAAIQDGPRGDSPLTLEQRRQLDNGIWLCSKCHKMVDDDELRYSVEVLRDWSRKRMTAILPQSCRAAARTSRQGAKHWSPASGAPFRSGTAIKRRQYRLRFEQRQGVSHD